MFTIHWNDLQYGISQISFIVLYSNNWWLEYTLVQCVDILLNRPSHLDLINDVTRFSGGKTVWKKKNKVLTPFCVSYNHLYICQKAQQYCLTSDSLRPDHMVHLKIANSRNVIMNLSCYQIGTLFRKLKRWPTFEGQKKRECSYHQHHSESEREHRYINSKRERWKRVLHLEHKDNAVWVLRVVTHQWMLISLVYRAGQHYGSQVWVRWRRVLL